MTEQPVAMEPPAPGNVVAALAAVQRGIGGIERMTAEDRRRRGLVASGADDRGVKYAYRGIDQIAAAAQPLFGRYGVVIVPTVLSRDTAEVTVADKPWTDTIVLVAWHIYGPGGAGDVIEARTEGWGRDNSDKGVNKAMTGAYKNLLLRLLSIGDPSDDTDGHTHEADSRATPPPEQAAPSAGTVLFERIRPYAGTPLAESLKALAEQHGKKLSESALNADAEWRATVERHIAIATAAPTPDEPTDAAEPVPAVAGEDPPSTRHQHQRIAIVTAKLGLDNSADRHRFAHAVTGRPVASTKDLTRDEAARVIDTADAVDRGALELVIADDGSFSFLPPAGGQQ